jgi:hypothetical protein
MQRSAPASISRGGKKLGLVDGMGTLTQQKMGQRSRSSYNLAPSMGETSPNKLKKLDL